MLVWPLLSKTKIPLSCSTRVRKKMKPYTNSSHLELISCLVLSAEIIVCVNAFFDDLRNGTSVMLPLEAM